MINSVIFFEIAAVIVIGACQSTPTVSQKVHIAAKTTISPVDLVFTSLIPKHL